MKLKDILLGMYLSVIMNININDTCTSYDGEVVQDHEVVMATHVITNDESFVSEVSYSTNTHHNIST